MINPLKWIFGIKGHVAVDRNPGPEYNTLLLGLFLGEPYSACPHRRFHTLPVLLPSQVTMSNSYSYACMPTERQFVLFL